MIYCGQCGKKVIETMLFCPFCGSPIVIPEQDEDQPAAPTPVEEPEEQIEQQELTWPEDEPVGDEPSVPEPEAEPDFEPLRFDEPEPEQPPVYEEAPGRPASLFDDVPDEEEAFATPDFDAPDPGRDDSAADEPEPPEDVISPEPPPKRPAAPERKRRDSAPRRSSQTYIPVKDVDLDDMFMENKPDARMISIPATMTGTIILSDDFDFEEPERDSFVLRHIRGIVGLTLLAMLAVICVIWLFTTRGQELLAPMNLAWNAEVYSSLGYDCYEAGQYRQAATYFERALARDGDEYEYAHSAMVAYYEAEEIDSALAMLKKCIEMDPNNPEPYHEALILYPDPATRPWEVQELLRLGYVRTADEALNISTE